MTQISITVSETAHWHALISRAEYHAHQLLPQGVENYLVRLFMRYEQEEKSIFQRNRTDEIKPSSEYKLQRLGDQCLLLCGFYPEASDDYGVALDEFIMMGSEAYQKLSTLNGMNAIIFEYLAGNFGQISEILCYINDVTTVPPDQKKQTGLKNKEDILAIPANYIEQYPFSSPISSRILN